jgi:hypothetical protein
MENNGLWWLHHVCNCGFKPSRSNTQPLSHHLLPQPIWVWSNVSPCQDGNLSYMDLLGWLVVALGSQGSLVFYFHTSWCMESYMYIFSKNGMDMHSLIKNDLLCIHVCVSAALVSMGVRVLPMVNTPSWVQWILATLTSASMRRNCEICWLTVVPLQGRNGALPSRKKTLAQIKSLGVLATAPYEFLFYSVGRVDLRQMGKTYKYIYIYTNTACMKSVYICIYMHKYVCILWHLGVDFGLHMHMYIPACLPSNKEKWATRGTDIAKTMWKLPHSGSYAAKIEKQHLKYFFRIIVPNSWKNLFFCGQYCACRQTKHAAQT